MKSINVSAIESAIEDVCGERSEFWISQGISLERIVDWEKINAFSSKLDGASPKGRVPFHFGILFTSDQESDDEVVAPSTTVGYASFSVAYSTWDGRLIYLDRFDFSSNCRALDTVKDGTIEAVELHVLKTLASLAVRLECSRLVWRHTKIPSWYTAESTVVQPDILHGWLTLAMDKDAMISYANLSQNESQAGGNTDTFDQPKLISTIEATLQTAKKQSTKNNVTFNIRLRLAGRNDVDAIARLVQGLADYEKEPDAVNVTSDNYRIDGFPKASSESPLFHCLLLDAVDGELSSTKTVGMAFFYFGSHLEEGNHLYLEDLYIEESYQKLGGGSLMMKALARCSYMLGCDRFYWQVLDWNTPARQFYERIGAKVQEGVITTRYAGDSLKQYASS